MGTSRPRVKDAVERFLARVRHNIDVHLETLGTDLVRALEEEGGKVSVDRLSDLAKSASTVQAQEGKLDVLAKLVGSMRMQDEATSLRAIIEALARGASGEATRVAVLLVDGETLRSFVDFGYAGGARPADVSLDSFPALARTLADRQRLLLTASGGRVPDVPAFMRAMSGNTGLIVPISVGASVVAVLYAEGPERPSGPGAHTTAASLWTEHVEVLVRHAASRLENVTSRRTVEVLTSSR
jgi:hypothetical protein